MLTAEPPLDVHVAPSILAADLAALGDAVARCAPPLRPPRRTALASHAPRSVEAHCDWLHLDVFDGVAVPNLTFGAGVVAALRPHSALLFDVHLCVTRATAEQLLAPLLAAGAGQISFHPSALGAPGAATDAAVAALVAAIRAGGARAAVSLAPDEPAEHAAAAGAAGAACVNVLCVTPGFGGQRMQAAALDKVRQLRRTHPRSAARCSPRSLTQAGRRPRAPRRPGPTRPRNTPHPSSNPARNSSSASCRSGSYA
jgi:ribulose-phosphate 3-epimerase